MTQRDWELSKAVCTLYGGVPEEWGCNVMVLFPSAEAAGHVLAEVRMGMIEGIKDPITGLT